MRGYCRIGLSKQNSWLWVLSLESLSKFILFLGHQRQLRLILFMLWGFPMEVVQMTKVCIDSFLHDTKPQSSKHCIELSLKLGLSFLVQNCNSWIVPVWIPCNVATIKENLLLSLFIFIVLFNYCFLSVILFNQIEWSASRPRQWQLRKNDLELIHLWSLHCFKCCVEQCKSQWNGPISLLLWPLGQRERLIAWF